MTGDPDTPDTTPNPPPTDDVDREDSEVGGARARGVLRERKDGPPLKVSDPEIRKRFIQGVRTGARLDRAAIAAGMGATTMFMARAKGRKAQAKVEAGEPITEDERECMDFVAEFEKARSEVMVRNFALIQQDAQGGQLVRRRTLPNGTVEEEYTTVNFRAAAKLLELSFGREFQQAIALEMSGPDGGPIQVESSPGIRELAIRVRDRARLEAERLAQLEVGDGDVVEGEVVEDDTA